MEEVNGPENATLRHVAARVDEIFVIVGNQGEAMSRLVDRLLPVEQTHNALLAEHQSHAEHGARLKAVEANLSALSALPLLTRLKLVVIALILMGGAAVTASIIVVERMR